MNGLQDREFQELSLKIFNKFQWSVKKLVRKKIRLVFRFLGLMSFFGKEWITSPWRFTFLRGVNWIKQLNSRLFRLKKMMSLIIVIYLAFFFKIPPIFGAENSKNKTNKCSFDHRVRIIFWLKKKVHMARKLLH